MVVAYLYLTSFFFRSIVKLPIPVLKPSLHFTQKLYHSYILTLLWEQRLGRMPTFSAGLLMADKADPRQAYSIALTTSEGLVGVWVGCSGASPGLSPQMFFFQSFTIPLHQPSGSAASVVHWLGSIWQNLRDVFRESLNLFSGTPLSLWPDESLPCKKVFVRQWSSILETWQAQGSQ